MKKILFASTALIASAGFAAAEISFSGEAGFGVIYNDVTGDWNPDYYTTLSVAMTGETDGGLSFGADFDITIDGGVGTVDDTAVYIEGGFGKLSVGNVGSAVDAKLGLGDIGYSGLGTDNVAELLIDAGDVGNMMYEGTFGDFSVAASYDMSGTEVWAIVAQYTMGDYSFGLGYDDLETLTVTAAADVADFSVAALYSTNDAASINAYGLTVGYTMGAVDLTAAYSNAENTGTNTSVDAYGLGVAYDLGGGATVKAGVGEVAGVTVADLGIVMNF